MPISENSDPGDGPLLRLRGVSVDYPSLRAVDGVDLTVGGPGGRVVALLGPSGCGKSTLLRALAGIEPLAEGSVSFGGVDLARTPAHRRGVGLVFQDGQLFAHRTVAGNIGYGLRGPYHGLTGPRGWLARRRRRDERVAELLELVGLEGFAGRPVDELSGGQAQRVALARALAPSPRLLLLDEPLSSLDRELRDRLAADISRVLRATGTPALLVTHDHGEAAALAERIAIMHEGRITQEAAPRQLWRYPRDSATARFLGYPEVIDARVLDGVAHCGFGSVAVRHPDGPVRLGLRAESVLAEPASAEPARGVRADRAAVPDKSAPGEPAYANAGEERSRGVFATVESVTALPTRTLVTVSPCRSRGIAPEAGDGCAAGGTIVATVGGGGNEGGDGGDGGGDLPGEVRGEIPAPGDVVALRLVAGQIAVITDESVREVAAGAIVAGSRVLVARRSHPPELAGRWELPGGKVEPGETGREGLRRELAEELGVTVHVGARMDGEVPIGGTKVLRAYRVVLISGEPEAREHAALRWVGPDELAGLDLVDGDRLWLPALRSLLDARGA